MNFYYIPTKLNFNLFLLCFFSSIAWFSALVIKTGSNLIEENPCDLSPNCMSDYLSVPVIKSTTLRCIKSTSCAVLGNTLPYIDQTNRIYINLKDIRIKQEIDSYWIQVVLSSYGDLLKQGNQSLLVKFSFERGSACYQFFVPFSNFMHSNDILVPCFRIKTFNRHWLRFYLSAHWDTGEVISIQGAEYSLKNAVDRQWLEGIKFTPTYDFDKEFLYLLLNATEDLKCVSNYGIEIYKSYSYDVCNIRNTPVYRWSSALILPPYRLNISQNLLDPYQKYCIYAFSSMNEQCGTSSSKDFTTVIFFQFLPMDKFTYAPTDKFYTDDPKNDCERWNFTIDVKVSESDVTITLRLWSQYAFCFSSYIMYLDNFNISTCNPNLSHTTLEEKNFKAVPDKDFIMVFKNVPAGYYCIMVTPLLNGYEEVDWARNSGSFNVFENAVSNTTVLTMQNDNPAFSVSVILAIGILLCFTAFSLCSYSQYRKRYKVRTGKQFSDEKEEKECLVIDEVIVDEVYVFHSHDDGSIKHKVELLKDFLKKGTSLEVISLSAKLPEIKEQPVRRLGKILECKCSGKGPACASKKKYILVISEKVLNDIDNESSVWVTEEELAFRIVFNSIADDWEKAHCHLYIVAFNESIFHDYRFKRIVPRSVSEVNYAIPNDLINLCTKLGSSSSKRIDREVLLHLLKHHDIRNIG